ncbi:hypothetical protein GXP67_19545 [Rhodocytophaga rosea]|uniref:Uncharacterized protein n=1 Tax=Rhodocytophaga rosea TaxID=2704465 RepID=A0A6C0GKS3_9BACT|nr:hypothetical protein [Rhodocytophaga rosea]QHT68681.1 hypothetical protein GXP67_19545 [Rhodocytophaga rosea]
MDKELFDRLDKIEKQLSLKEKDYWEKLQVLTPILIPIIIALAGWYFTDQHNKNQLEIEKNNNENQLQVALINSSVGQSELIKDFMQHLADKDTSIRNIAIEAILYAAPTPGKKIVEIIAKTSNGNAKKFAIDALKGKRQDLVSNLFSSQKQNRLIAASEISTNWTTDNEMLSELLAKAGNCLTNKETASDCDNGVYNTIIVISNFSRSLLVTRKEEIQGLVSKIPKASPLTLKQVEELLNKIN